MSGKLYDRQFLRFLFRLFGVRFVDRRKELFTPYFQYRIGPFVADYHLYFRREPSWIRYRFEFFSRLYEYSGYGLTLFLDFHYQAYPDKADFRRFLRYEVEEELRLFGKRGKRFRGKREMVLIWLQEQEAVAGVGVTSAAGAEAPGTAGEAGARVGGAELEAIETTMTGVMRSFTGAIGIDLPHHLERFIQLLIMIKDIKAPGKGGAPVFREFSATDLAAILRNIEIFRGMRVNSLQKRITEESRKLRDDERALKMKKALVEYFYGRLSDEELTRVVQR